MNRVLKKNNSTVGAVPGAVVHIGERKLDAAKVTVISYDAEKTEKRVITRLELLDSLDPGMFHWINIDGLHDVDLVQQIGEKYFIHPLLLEDIVNTTGSPKIDSFDNHLLVILKMISTSSAENVFDSEQVSILFGKNLVITFQEQEGDVFEPIRERIFTGKGRLRKKKADYLFHSLIDIIVDNYFIVFDKLSDIVEPLEDEIMDKPVNRHAHAILQLKKQLMFLRKAIWPLREVVSAIMRDHVDLIEPDTILYFRDVYEHVLQVIDYIETSRDILVGLHDSYITSLSNNMNSVMKVLTLIATIFIPLTFIAGVYGMNFKNMPELGWDWAYFAVLGFMGAVGIFMIIYFKIKKWF
ncbi:MAG: magnesium/cobalt transporter CorA [Spirochaetales bacterium]|nr:magnesium/cobalt transporter CorA [Spirochaetales bacterium]